jgi:multidrug efflux pump subunit AcrA (membrane-fusion protein)
LNEARRLSSIAWAVLIASALFLALVFVPADFEISVQGELLPAQRREIFAPTDGVLEAILVEHGDDVVPGQPLLRLRSTALDLESARIDGEIQTAEKRLAAILAARLESDSDPKAREGHALALTAEEEELKETLKSFRQQEQLIDRQRAELEVRSPQGGRILTWDVARTWSSRPVERGQSLLSLGNVSGDWQLELRVPDHQIGYVMDAAEKARRENSPLAVSFLMFAVPHAVYEGEVSRIAMRGQWDESRNESVVLVTVRCSQPIDEPVAGTTVIGKIQCGRRSLGFVWFHNAWNSIRRRLLF